jgi:hypothetical protein
MTQKQTKNRIVKGVHGDNDPRYQPIDTMRDSINGVIMDAGQGNYIWQTIKGTSLSFSLSSTNRIMAWCVLRDRFFLLTLYDSASIVRIWEVTFSTEGLGSTDVRWTGSNAELNLSFDTPIRRMIGFYENQEIQRIYFTDYNNPPRVINVGYSDPADKSITINTKFLPFTPKLENGYGSFIFDSIQPSGSCKAGTYFICWRYYHQGYYTDWSYLSNPVQVNPGVVQITADAYQEFQGDAPDANASKTIRFKISDIDTDYDSMQVAYFYSNDLDSSGPGVIFYDGDIDSAEMTFNLFGNENAGTVTLAELIATSLTIDKCRDMDFIKRRNVIANIDERAELSIGNSMDCEISLIQREVLLDNTGYPADTWSAGYKALVASHKAATVTTGGIVYGGVQYYGTAGGAASIGGSPVNFATGEIIQFADKGTLTTGQLTPTVALKKYKKATAPPVPDYTDYEWNRNNIDSEYMDWKSPTITNMLKSYPGGEKIRLGIVFLDLTGRPFYARWLNNTDATLGTGDVTIPFRNAETDGIALINNYDITTTADGDVYAQTNGVSLGLSISGLDITDVADQISGFMIVRAPIVRRFIGMGIINKVHNAVNDLFAFPYFYEYNSDAAYEPNVYSIYCPDQVFGLKNFSIQAGDKLVPLQYLNPYNISEAAPELNYEGMGTEEITGGATDRRMYQKFLIPITGTDGAEPNGTLLAEHEILYNTPYQISDDDVVIDPRNEALLYQSQSASIPFGTLLRGRNNDHAVLVLDTEDPGPGASADPVGHYQRASTDPIALLCSIKRENNNPYGGTGDSSLSNTTYQAIGHYQEINPTVLADILQGGRYIFNEIEIFGGDSFITLMDINRIIADQDEIGGNGTYAHSIIYPVETRVNTSLRKGVHIAKDRSYEATQNPLGIRFKSTDFRLPEFNYNDGYSSNNVGDYYLPIPYNFNDSNVYDVMARYSGYKTSGEREDSFRKFLPDDYIEVDPNAGEIMNIRNKFDRLVYWQRDAVGYIPVEERALTSNALGDPIELGTGDLFVRYDNMSVKVGNSHQFGLVESDMGFHWYDTKREIYLTLTETLKFTQESIAKGWNNFFENTIGADILPYDNPFNSYGILGGYDPQAKIAYSTFKLPNGTYRTIAFDTRLNTLIGQIEQPAGMYMKYNNLMYSIPVNSGSVYVHSKGNYLNIYNTALTASLQVVVKLEELESVYFDDFVVNGGEQFFEQIVVETADNTVTETIQKYQGGQYRFVKRDYLYRNGQWMGTFPKAGRNRFKDTYAIITFSTSIGLTKFLDMVSSVRKAY